MGMEDRDYYWEDRKRRENKFDKKNTYYCPKEFRQSNSHKPGKPANDWQGRRNIAREQWKVLVAFLAGCFTTLWVIMIILHLNPDLLFVPYQTAQRALEFTGAL